MNNKKIYRWDANSFLERRLIYYESASPQNVSIPPMLVDKNDALLVIKTELDARKKTLYDQLQNTQELNARKAVLSQIQEINQNQPNTVQYRANQSESNPDFKGSKARKDIYMKDLIETLSSKPNPIIINSPIELEAIMQFGNTINRPEGLHIILRSAFQNTSLHLNPGTPIKRSDGTFEMTMNGSPEFAKKVFNPPITIDGQGVTLKECNLFHVNGVTLKNITLQKNETDLKPPNQYGIREDRLLRMNDVENINIEGVHLKGVPLDIEGFKKGNIEGIAGAHKGILIQGGTNVTIKDSSFDNLYHAIECMQVQGGSISNNNADMLVSDFITGGGFKNMNITNNTLGLRIPIILGKNKDGLPNKVHSDFIQLYTTQGKNTDWDMKNEHVRIEGNIEKDPRNNSIYQALLASPEARKHMIGVQGILVGDENKVGNTDIAIKNNQLWNNQYNGIHIDAQNSYVDDNVITAYENPNIGDPIEKSNPQIILNPRTTLISQSGNRINKPNISTDTLSKKDEPKSFLLKENLDHINYRLGKNSFFEFIKYKDMASLEVQKA